MALRPDHDPKMLAKAMDLLSALVGSVPGMLDFVSGPNLDFEQKSPDFGHGFIITFADRDAHLAYDVHPDHKIAGSIIVSLCKGGHQGIFVADINIA